MKLTQALKQKKKLIAAADKYFKRFTAANSHEVSKTPTYDAKENYDLWRETIKKLITLKAQIQITNGPILGKIYELAELKNIVSKLKSTNCNKGLVEKGGGYGVASVDVEYTAWLTEKQRDDNVDDLEERIEIIQSEIEAFNATTEML